MTINSTLENYLKAFIDDICPLAKNNFFKLIANVGNLSFIFSGNS